MSTNIILNRQWVLCVGRDGAVKVRDSKVTRTAKQARADFVEAMPVYSTDTKEEADSLIVYRCRLARDGSGVYTLNTGAPGSGEELASIGAMFADDHVRYRIRKASAV